MDLRYFPFFNSGWKIEAIKYMLSLDEGVTCQEVWVGVNKSFDFVRRAQVINFLKCLSEMGLADFKVVNNGEYHQDFYQLNGRSRVLFEKIID